MAEIKKDYTNKGKITCNKNILLSIINLATKEISGVASLKKKFKKPNTKHFYKKNFYCVGGKLNKN